MCRHNKESLIKVFTECIDETIRSIYYLAYSSKRAVNGHFVIMLYTCLFQKVLYFLIRKQLNHLPSVELVIPGALFNQLHIPILFYNSFSISPLSFLFMSSNSDSVGRQSSLYIFSIGYHQTGPTPLFP